jgi:hypothetical protein
VIYANSKSSLFNRAALIAGLRPKLGLQELHAAASLSHIRDTAVTPYDLIICSLQTPLDSNRCVALAQIVAYTFRHPLLLKIYRESPVALPSLS